MSLLLTFPLLLSLTSSSPLVVRPAQYHVFRQLVSPHFPRYPVFSRDFQTSPVVLDIEDVAHDCTAEGIFVNPEDCGSYFICNDNGFGLKATKVNCPGSQGNKLVFNPSLGVCDWASRVPGCSARLGRPKPEPILVDPFFEYDCAATEGIFYNPEDCGSYVSCNSNVDGVTAAKVDCVPGLFFNDELKVCDWPSNVPDCAQRTVAGNLVPEVEPIIACTDWDRVGRVFIPCTSPVQACEDGTFRVSCEPESNPWWWTVEENPEGLNCSVLPVGKYEDPENCDKYLVCSGDGGAYRYSCAEGTYYNKETGECDHKGEVECSSRDERR